MAYYVEKPTEGTQKDIAKAINRLADIQEGVEKPKRYGIKINKYDSNPDTRIEYILDAQGFVPARMNYDTGEFDYGSWGDIWFIKDNYPCMVKYDGTEDYRLDPNDYSFKLDGNPSDVANVEYGGNAMSAIPLVWIKQYEIGGYEYIILCEVQYDETYKAYAHTRSDGSIMDRIYLAMFRGSDDGTRLRSISGLQPMHTETAQTEISKAEANGSLWTTRTWAHRNLINCLLTVISKHDNSQTAFGNGNLNYTGIEPTCGVLQTGTLNTEGQFVGYNDNTHQVKVFHIEAWWADQYERIQGLLNINGDIRVKMTPPYNLVGTDFISTGLTPAGKNGYLTESKMSEFGRIPVVSGAGSSNTYQCDYFYFNNSTTTVARVGGHCNDGFYCGFSGVALNDSAASANWNIGAALSCEQPLVA
ncbi:hypothetical protein [Garciella nitratireducens]|uniref:Uncharacterized protein n=1 Tax=Garciella nitratireducens DSM 15102 TaxID=1121911 RepID=A0A1T4K5T0_9FIRM|nr:hypothetical protein [Garciella nitratireducens]SJZ37766.1 hypothetical protein SAMN02745973_00360 [Garciella nitratireducens DSM 15102]